MLQLVIGGQPVDMVHEAIGFSNIHDCDSEQSACARRPCQNNGVCQELSPILYICRCPSQFTGLYSVLSLICLCLFIVYWLVSDLLTVQDD